MYFQKHMSGESWFAAAPTPWAARATFDAPPPPTPAPDSSCVWVKLAASQWLKPNNEENIGRPRHLIADGRLL